MKTSRYSLIQFASIALILFIGIVSSCQNPGDPAAAETMKADTVFQEGVDTIIIFDPETQFETVEIRKYTDTIVNGQSLKRHRFFSN